MISKKIIYRIVYLMILDDILNNQPKLLEYKKKPIQLDLFGGNNAIN